MKPGIPWSVKGIEDDAREAAKHAARRSGMTLGEWLNNMILDQSGEIPALRPPTAPVSAPDISGKLDDIAHQLARLAARDQDTAVTRVVEQPPPPDFGRDLAGKLLARIENTERQTAESVSGVHQRIDALGRQIAQLPKPQAAPRIEDSPAISALEGALRNVVDHIETSERQTRESLRAMQDRMSGIAQRAAQAEGAVATQAAPAIGRLENRIAGMVERLERTEASALRDLPSRIEGEISKLVQRIDGMKAVTETAIQRSQGNAQRELRDIEERIHGLLKDAQTSFQGQGFASATELQRLRGEIEGLAQRFDDLKTDSASERDVQGLRIAIEQMSARVAQGPDLRPLADLDRKLVEITRRLEEGQNDPRTSSQLAELESRVYDLDRRLATTMAHPQTQNFEPLEAQISAVADRLTATEQQFGHLASIGSSINQLYESLEHSKAWTREVAEDAAARMADRLLERQALLQPAGGSSAELMALQEGLAAVRASAAAADQRHQDTLDAVHETLEQIVNRLAEVEADPEPEPASSLHQPVPPRPEPQLVAPPPPQPRAGPSPIPDWQPSAAMESLSPIPADPVFPAALDFEEPELPPSAAIPYAQAAVAPAPMAAGEAPAPAEPQFPRDDFIAAARRAAQAAALRQAGPMMTNTLVDKAKRSASGVRLPSFRLPFLNRKSRVARAGRVQAQPQGGTKRRALILAGLVLLAAVSAYSFAVFNRNPAPSVPQRAPVVSPTTPKGDGPGATLQDKRSLGDMQQSGMPTPETLSQPMKKKTSALASDQVLTGALPAKQDTTLAAIVTDHPSSEAAGAGEMPSTAITPESLRRAAGSGDPVAQFVIATRYFDGAGIEQDLTQAARWYQKAANSGLAPAEYRIATLFERGRGVPQDVATARVWYERAAAQGNTKAMHNVAVIYAGNQAGQPDYVKAAQWFGAAAEHGVKDSEFNLAVLYERGLGVQQNMGEALFWYSLAGRQNDRDALKKAETIAQSLTPTSVNDIKTRLANWQAKTALPEANVVAIADAQWQAPSAPSNAAASNDPLPEATAMPETGDLLQPQDLPVTGDANAEAAPSDSDLVLATQQQLTNLGYNIGKPDGHMGSRTANAIRLFELQSGLKVTGQPSAELLAKMKASRG